jgi:hypothetical protein
MQLFLGKAPLSLVKGATGKPVVVRKMELGFKKNIRSCHRRLKENAEKRDDSGRISVSRISKSKSRSRYWTATLKSYPTP